MPALTLDHAGCAIEHGLPQGDREFTLEDTQKIADSKLGPARATTCPSCFAVLPLGTAVCPLCVTVLGGATAPLRETPGVLVEAAPNRLPPPRAPPTACDRAVLDVLRRAARSGGRFGWDDFASTQAGATTR